MTAGQRNCYEAMKAEAAKYGLDDVLFAARELLRDAARDAKACGRYQAREHFNAAMIKIEYARNWAKRAQEELVA